MRASRLIVGSFFPVSTSERNETEMPVAAATSTSVSPRRGLSSRRRRPRPGWRVDPLKAAPSLAWECDGWPYRSSILNFSILEQEVGMRGQRRPETTSAGALIAAILGATLILVLAACGGDGEGS